MFVYIIIKYVNIWKPNNTFLKISGRRVPLYEFISIPIRRAIQMLKDVYSNAFYFALKSQTLTFSHAIDTEAFVSRFKEIRFVIQKRLNLFIILFTRKLKI